MLILMKLENTQIEPTVFLFWRFLIVVITRMYYSLSRGMIGWQRKF